MTTQLFGPAYTIPETLLQSEPKLGSLTSIDFVIVMNYLMLGMEHNDNAVDTIAWYAQVHTFLLLVCEAEGI